MAVPGVAVLRDAPLVRIAQRHPQSWHLARRTPGGPRDSFAGVCEEGEEADGEGDGEDCGCTTRTASPAPGVVRNGMGDTADGKTATPVT